MQISTANAADFSAKEELSAFVTQVLGIDLSQYNQTNENYKIKYPSTYGGVVKEEDLTSDYYANDGSHIQVFAVIYNGYPGMIIIDCLGSTKYVNQPLPENKLNAAKTVLARYPSFAAAYGIDSQAAVAASTMLEPLTELVTTETTQGNMKMEAWARINSDWLSLIGSTVNDTGIDWTYTAKGYDADKKCLRVTFAESEQGFEVIFQDTWGLFQIADVSVSEFEAKNIARSTASKLNLTSVGADNSTVVLHPDWSGERVDARLVMVPGQVYNDSLNAEIHYADSGSIVREPLMLYPEWVFIFYFDKNIGDMTGVQVGVWGDTGEIVLCTAYGHYGNGAPIWTPPSTQGHELLPNATDLPTPPSSPTLTPISSPNSSPTNTPIQTQSPNPTTLQTTTGTQTPTHTNTPTQAPSASPQTSAASDLASTQTCLNTTDLIATILTLFILTALIVATAFRQKRKQRRLIKNRL
ncbi:MAG: hypothetical protein NWF05_12035 [Candidatus Bathyarchaeota archaeon]|nr:hypothetical protein [Candidatus Bathyarchaeota archaeon]